MIQYKAKIPLSPDTIIWRYSDPLSFINQYINGTIGFTKLTTFQDYYEGRLKDISFFESLYFGGKSKRDSEKNRKDILEKFQKLIDNHFASCWTISQNEDFALWKSFSDKNGGVAIKTTISKFIESLPNSLILNHEEITYKPFYKRSFCRELFKIEDYIYTKYEFYSYEKEYRFVIKLDDIIPTYKVDPKHINIPIDYSLLIDNLYLSPYMSNENSDMFLKSFKSLNSSHKIKIQKSAIRIKFQ